MLILGDCEYLLATLPGLYDLVVTSPPYDNLRSYKGFDNWSSLAQKLYNSLRPGGVVAWVCADQTVKGSETGTSFKTALAFIEAGFNLHDTMIYHKDNPVPVGGHNRYYQAFEYIFIFSKGKPKTFNPILVPRRNKHNDKRTSRVKSFNRTKEGEFIKKKVVFKETVKKNNVWTYTVGGGNSVEYGIKHPAVMPLKLAEDLITSFSNPGDHVLDPFLGSGTTAIAARKLGRKVTGMEIDKEYYKEALERITRVST